MRLIGIGVGAALLLTGCSGTYAATPVVTIPATAPATNPAVGVTIVALVVLRRLSVLDRHRR